MDKENLTMEQATTTSVAPDTTEAAGTLDKVIAATDQSWNRQGDVVVEFAEQLDKRWKIAKAIAASGLTGHRKPEAILAIQLAAYEIGLPFMTALRGMFYLDGKIGLEGHLMDALAVQRCGVTKTIVERTPIRCELVLHRDGWDDVTVSYSMEDAKTAGLISGWDKDGVKSSKLNWRKHPREMLYWRALSSGLKIIAPDHFGGIYTVDELQAVAEGHTTTATPTINAELEQLEVDTTTISVSTKPVPSTRVEASDQPGLALDLE